MKRDYFGTDGVRGPYGGPVINEDFAARLGCAAARWARARGAAPGELVLIGRDTRGSGASLVRAVAAGLRAGGLAAVSLGVTPTPAVARAVRARAGRLGVVVTASHNPAADNGIKFFAVGGLKLSDADEAEIEALLPGAAASGVDGAPASGRPTSEAPEEDGVADYAAELAGMLPGGALAGWRVVVDAANGATARSTPEVLRRLGAEVRALGVTPDGANINAGVGSEHPELMAREVVACGARLGVAHDGDGDRCILCDENGVVLDGDEILTILALDALGRGALAARTLVVTVQSNLGVDAAIRAAGGEVERTDVGDRHVLARLIERGARLGGESSGHIIDLNASPTGDGLAAALGVLAVMRATGKPLSELRRVLRKFPQGTRNLRVAEKKPLAECAALVAELAALAREMGGGGRVMARFSGTEAKLRLLAEAGGEVQVISALDRLEAAAKRDLRVSV
jgi:phosphoglucosamine mutase